MLYRRIATAFTLFSLIMSTVVPLASGGRAYDAKILLDWIEVTAVVWASVIAAETLTEMERARRVELTPVFDISLTSVHQDGSPCLLLHISNLGRGSAAGLHAWAVFAPTGVEFSEIVKIDNLNTVFHPLSSQTRTVQTHWTNIVSGQLELCDCIIHVRYRDAFGEKTTIRNGFAIGSAQLEVRRVNCPAELTPLEQNFCTEN